MAVSFFVANITDFSTIKCYNSIIPEEKGAILWLSFI